MEYWYIYILYYIFIYINTPYTSQRNRFLNNFKFVCLELKAMHWTEIEFFYYIGYINKRNTIVVTVFLLTLNQTEFLLAPNQLRPSQISSVQFCRDVGRVSMGALNWALHQTELRVVPNQSEKCNYHPNLVWFNKIEKIFLRVHHSCIRREKNLP